MALFNHATKEVTAKLVYYGPGLGGKTTNLQWIHERIDVESKGRLVSLSTQTDRTLFFDFLPLELGTIRGMRTRIQIYTVPGQVFYEATRRMVLKGCDAVVFVADSQAAMLDANSESFQSLRRNLLANEIDPTIPMVIQYNKRDLPTALPIPVLNGRLNPRGLPTFEAVALQGTGVEETLKGITQLLFRALSDFYGGPETAAQTAPPPSVVTPEVASPPSPAPRAPVSRPVGPGFAVAPLAPGTAPGPEGPREALPGGGPPLFRGSEPADPPPRGGGLRPDQWLYLLEGDQRGPIDVESLVDLVLSSIPEDTKVWHPGLEGWVHANRVREIAEEIPPPLPAPGAARGAFVDEDMPDFNTVPPQFRTALIADEDESFRKYLTMPLAAQGFTIHEAGDGSAAWLLAVQHRPWLILADVSMPEVDGFEFCRRVRSHPLLSHTPLLFISGSDKYKERYRALQIGADDFMSKQMPIRELLMRIQLLLTRYSDLGGNEKLAGPAEAAGAFQGRIEVFGAPALLQMCAQGGLSGLFTALAEDEGNTTAVLGFRAGEIISAALGVRSGAEAVYAYLGWEKGSFKFTPGDPGRGEPLAQSVEHLLLEGCRRLDESQHSGEAARTPLPSSEPGAPGSVPDTPASHGSR
jgi:CheY-like chemotaxis protein/signal recognition particle receptor subunit beta